MLIVLAAGCQPPPRPFATDRPNPLLDAPQTAGVVVDKVEGLPTEVAEELRAAVVTALQEGRILASRGPGNRASLHLKGEGTMAAGESSARAYIDWRFLDSEGRELAAFQSAPELRPGAIAEANARAIDNIVRRVGQSLEQSRVLARRPPAEPPASTVTVSVLPVEGAPGDGRESLTQALQLMLRNAGLKVASQIDADGLLVYGDVAVAPVLPDKERVDLQWTVKWPDGREVGRVTQSNEIPVGLLRRRWGQIALAAAEGAAAGIVALVRQAVPAEAPSSASAPPPPAAPDAASTPPTEKPPPTAGKWMPVYSPEPG